MKNKLAIAILLIIIMVVVYGGTATRKVTFNQQEWKQADRTQRYRMAKDLQNSPLLIGMSPDEIINILGKPDSIHGSSISYKLNDPIGFKDMLTIHHENNKAISAYIHD